MSLGSSCAAEDWGLGPRVHGPLGENPQHTVGAVNLEDGPALHLYNQLFLSLMDELPGLKDYSNHRRTV